MKVLRLFIDKVKSYDLPCNDDNRLKTITVYKIFSDEPPAY